MFDGDETTRQAAMFASFLLEVLSEPEKQSIPLCNELFKVNKS
jgi:hypothetical protein